MKKHLLGFTAILALCTGMALAQEPPHRGQWQGQHQAFADLNLTADQQQQARTIFENAHQQAGAVEQQLKQKRDELNTDIQNGATDAQIDALSNAMAPLLAQTTAIHSKAMAKFYAILTPDQKTKAASHANRMMMGPGSRGPRGQ